MGVPLFQETSKMAEPHHCAAKIAGPDPDPSLQNVSPHLQCQIFSIWVFAREMLIETLHKQRNSTMSAEAKGQTCIDLLCLSSKFAWNHVCFGKLMDRKTQPKRRKLDKGFTTKRLRNVVPSPSRLNSQKMWLSGCVAPNSSISRSRANSQQRRSSFANPVNRSSA